MQTVTLTRDMQLLAQGWQQRAKKIALVPTMGNLHAGHLSLIKYAQEHADKIVVSIFVNPTQFNETNDYTQYPRTLAADIEKLSALNVDTVFTPDSSQIYPQGLENINYVELTGKGNELAQILEGEQRPGHFRGVATVVKNLFDIVQPQLSVFGEKDFQQLLVIKAMTEQFKLPVKVIGRETVRERDGLAMSSRNQHLSSGQRKQAASIYSVLSRTRDALREQGEITAGMVSDLENAATNTLRENGFEPEYFTIRDVQTLASPVSGSKCLILTAAQLDSTRLIDNIRV